MQSIVATVVSVLTFTSSLVFTPQQAIRNVLGESDEAVEVVEVEEVESSDVQDVGTGIEFKEKRIQSAGEAKEAKFEARGEARERRAEARKDLREHREEARENARDRRAEFREKIRDRRAEIRETIKEKREEMREKLAEIKDEKKKQIAERVCNRFETLNGNLTTRFTNVLGRLSELIGKIESRAAKASENGHDTSSCDGVIDSAYAAISTAQETVDAQAGNDYVCEITDEASLGDSLSSTRQQLGADFKSVRDSIHEARTSIRSAVECLKGIRNVDVEPATNETG